MKNGIKYKDVTAMPGSTLHQLLTDAANAKSPQLAQELRNKAEMSHNDTCAKHERLLKGV